jgi:tripartite-type tricarboxylate transporter receptor subunit TctC
VCRVGASTALRVICKYSFINNINKDIVSILGQPDVQKLVLAEGGEITPGTPEEFAALLRVELVKWTQTIKRAGITTA